MREDCFISKLRRKRPTLGRSENETLMGLPYSCRNKTDRNIGVGASICNETGSGWKDEELYEEGGGVLDW